MNEYQSVDDLVVGIKETSGFLVGLFSPKSGLIFLLIVFGVILSRLLF